MRHKASGYIQITMFDKEINDEEACKDLRNCYKCLMFESHRCRNEISCPEGSQYEEYTGSIVRQCLCATVEIFQDGFIHCPILNYIGCEKCKEDFGDGSNFIYEESQNYEKKPKWK